MFESFSWPYMALRMLHFLLYPLEMSILVQLVHFLRLCIAIMTLTLYFVIRYLNSKAANIISLAFIFRQLLSKVIHLRNVIVKTSFSHNIISNAA